jgi:hypothetical protein
MMSYLNFQLNLIVHLAFSITLLSHLYFLLNFTGHIAFSNVLREETKKKKSYLQNARILLYINTDHFLN